MLTATGFDDHASRQILLGAPLVEFRERLLALHAAAGPRMTGDCFSSVSPSALLQSLLSIDGGELNFKLMDLITERSVRWPSGFASDGSEANKIIERFNRLSTDNHQDIINFLCSR